MTEKGILPIGVNHKGSVHTAFELRTQKMRDVRDALDELSGKKNDINLAAVLYRKRLVALGTIPVSEITTDMLLDMEQFDFEAIEEADKRLKKKLIPSAGTDEQENGQ